MAILPGSVRVPGEKLAVRSVDYENMATNVLEHVPKGAVVVSGMAHEISWLTGRSTIGTPLTQEQLRELVERFDVKAVYEHPIAARDWPYLRGEFELVDIDDGRLWLRR